MKARSASVKTPVAQRCDVETNADERPVLLTGNHAVAWAALAGIGHADTTDLLASDIDDSPVDAGAGRWRTAIQAKDAALQQSYSGAAA